MNDQEFGELKATVAALEKEVGAMRVTLEALLAKANKFSGVVALLIVCLPTAAAGVVAWFFGAK